MEIEIYSLLTNLPKNIMTKIIFAKSTIKYGESKPTTTH